MDELTSQKGELTRLVDELTRLFDELTRHFDQFTSPLRRPLPGPAGCPHAARCRFEDQREGGEAGGGGTHRRSAGGRRRAACGGGVHQRAGRGRQQHTSTRRQRSCSACTCNVGAPCTTGWGSASEAEPTRAQCEAGRQASWQAGRRAGRQAGTQHHCTARGGAAGKSQCDRTSMRISVTTCKSQRLLLLHGARVVLGRQDAAAVLAKEAGHALKTTGWRPSAPAVEER